MIQGFLYAHSGLCCDVKPVFGQLHYTPWMYCLIVMFIIHVTVNGAKAKHFPWLCRAGADVETDIISLLLFCSSHYSLSLSLSFLFSFPSVGCACAIFSPPGLPSHHVLGRATIIIAPIAPSFCFTPGTISSREICDLYFSNYFHTVWPIFRSCFLLLTQAARKPIASPFLSAPHTTPKTVILLFLSLLVFTGAFWISQAI